MGNESITKQVLTARFPVVPRRVTECDVTLSPLIGKICIVLCSHQHRNMFRVNKEKTFALICDHKIWQAFVSGLYWFRFFPVGRRFPSLSRRSFHALRARSKSLQFFFFKYPCGSILPISDLLNNGLSTKKLLFLFFSHVYQEFTEVKFHLMCFYIATFIHLQLRKNLKQINLIWSTYYLPKITQEGQVKFSAQSEFKLLNSLSYKSKLSTLVSLPWD